MAPEFPPRSRFIGERTSLKALRGKVVLLDFFTTSSTNWLRTLPVIQDWKKKYETYPFQVVGVHSPEFSYEMDEERVEEVLRELGVTYSVLLDPEFRMWKQYANHWWPRQFVIDAKGHVIYDHIGEGGYFETETAIQRALLEAGVRDLPALAPETLVGGGICYRTTPELYFGYLRGRYGSIERVLPGEEQAFLDRAEKQDDLLYLQGHWKVEGESLVHERALPGKTDYFSVKYSGFSVHLIAGSLTSKSILVEVELDGHPIPADLRGEDIVEKDDKTYVKLGGPRNYQVIASEVYHRGILKVKTDADHLVCFALSFGSCAP